MDYFPKDIVLEQYFFQIAEIPQPETYSHLKSTLISNKSEVNVIKSNCPKD